VGAEVIDTVLATDLDGVEPRLTDGLDLTLPTGARRIVDRRDVDLRGTDQPVKSGPESLGP
jgi:hypothetical protein